MQINIVIFSLQMIEHHLFCGIINWDSLCYVGVLLTVINKMSLKVTKNVVESFLIN